MAGATVTTRGEAVAPTRPDEGIWMIELSSLDASPDQALATVATQSKELETLLGELGVPTEKRSRTGVTVREEYDWESGRQTHRGYRAQNLVTVRSADPAIAGRLIEGAIARAKASVRGPAWWIAPDNQARLEACRQAAVEAKRKAEAYADALGLHLGAVAEIRESAGGGIEPRPAAGPIALRAAAPEPSLQIDPGELEVKTQVDVTFHLEG
jgi:uncharacterized protein YggE